MAASPSALRTKRVEWSTKNTTTMFITTDRIMLSVLYSERMVSSEVKAAGPANSGNASGTIEPASSGPLFLKISTSSSISSAMRNRMIEPATANSLMLTPKK